MIHGIETQKAKGISFLHEHPGTATENGFIVPHHHFVKATDSPLALSIVGELMSFPIFARPCPQTPRHGFVDSRVIDSVEQLIALSKETMKEDKKAEIALTKTIFADYNAVVANGILSIGPGNDGATAGKNTVSIHINSRIMADDLIPSDIVTAEQESYYEFVYADKTAYLVQLRSGPQIQGAGGNFVPEETVVKAVLNVEQFKKEVPPELELLEWEKLIEELKDTEGLVVDHCGGSMGSHFAVHAIANNIPVVFTRGVKVGETLEQEGDKQEINVKAFKQGFQDSISGDLLDGSYESFTTIKDNLKKAAQVAIAFLHNYGSFTFHDPAESRLAGVACGFFCRVGTALAAGEARHKQVFSGSRQEVYFDAWKSKQGSLPSTLFKALDAFMNKTWGGAYGGPNWAACSESVRQIWNAAVAGDTSKAITELNKGINLAHNGGWWFNKVMQQSDMTKAATNPGSYATRLAPLMHQAIKSKPVKDPLFQGAHIFAEIAKPEQLAVKEDAILPTFAPKLPKLPKAKKLKPEKIKQIQIRPMDGSIVKIQVQGIGQHQSFTFPATTQKEGGYFRKDIAMLWNVALTEKSMAGSSDAKYAPLEIKDDGWVYLGVNKVIGKNKLMGLLNGTLLPTDANKVAA